MQSREILERWCETFFQAMRDFVTSHSNDREWGRASLRETLTPPSFIRAEMIGF